MKTQEILRRDWPKFFESFSRRHSGWPIILEVFGAEIGDQIEGRNLALEGISANLFQGGAKIEIMMGSNANHHVTHTIAAPTQVSLERTDEGADAVLLIKSSNDTAALLRFIGTCNGKTGATLG